MSIQTVGMISSYSNLNQSGDWLWQQTPHPFGIWENIQVSPLAEKPDFLLLYQFDFPNPSPPLSWSDRLRQKKPKPQVDVKSLLRGVPQERIIYVLREPPLNEIIEITKKNYQAAENYCGYITGSDDFAPQPDYMPAIWYHAKSFNDLNEMPIPEKVAPCSWVTSGINRTVNHRQRLDFLKSLHASGTKFDLYGRDLPKWFPSQGELGHKWHGMAPYYYNLSIENYADNSWYVSEKLWDALLAWCLPIYYGELLLIN